MQYVVYFIISLVGKIGIIHILKCPYKKILTILMIQIDISIQVMKKLVKNLEINEYMLNVKERIIQ